MAAARIASSYAHTAHCYAATKLLISATTPVLCVRAATVDPSLNLQGVAALTRASISIPVLGAHLSLKSSCALPIQVVVFGQCWFVDCVYYHIFSVA